MVYVQGRRLSTTMASRSDDKRLELLQGTLDMLILRTLQWGPRHGHGIGQAIRTQSDDLLKVETGSSVSRAAPAGETRMAEGRLGDQRGQTAREVLPVDRGGQGAASSRTQPLVAARARDWPHHEPRADG